MKIFGYINITKIDTYSISINPIIDKVKIFLNGFLIIDGTSNPSVNTTDLFLNTGIYLVYVEKIALPTDTSLDILMNPSTSTKKTQTIDTYLHPTLNYTLLNNAKKSKSDGTLAFCKSDTNLFTAGNICATSLTSSDILKKHVTDFCFIDGGLAKNSEGKLNSLCKATYSLNNINNNIKNDFKDKYNKWADDVIRSTSKIGNEPSVPFKIAPNIPALMEYIKDEKPQADILFGTDINKPNNLIKYCEGEIGDNYQASSTSGNMCDILYTNSNYTTNEHIIKSINNKKKSYCLGKDKNGILRYENENICKGDYTGLLKDTIDDRCVKNNIYNKNDPWCNSLSDNNINSNVEPYKRINDSRTILAKNDLNSAASDMTKNKLIIDENSYKYIIDKYNNYPNKKLTDEVLTQKLFDFCENKETDYPADPNSQCKGIYDKFKDQPKIIESKLKMRDSLCKLPANITSNNKDDKTTNALSCATTIFDTSKDLGKFATAVNAHCESSNNISTKVCQDYYTNIEDKILQTYGIASVAAPKPSGFQNKFTYENKYDNIELESFQNEVDQNTSVNAKVSIEQIYEPSKNKEIDINNLYDLTDCNDTDTKSSEFMYYLLVFIFVFLITMLCTSCIRHYTNQNKNLNVQNIPIKKL